MTPKEKRASVLDISVIPIQAQRRRHVTGPVKHGNDTNSVMITLTESAKQYLSSVAPPSDYVSLGVKGGGCSGMQYVWDFASNHPSVTWSDPIDNVLVVDPMAEMFLIGSEIDYVTELGGSFLKVVNPVATSSCGCGESFSA